MCKIFKFSMIVFAYRSIHLVLHSPRVNLGVPICNSDNNPEASFLRGDQFGAHIQQAGAATSFEALSAFRTSLAAQRSVLVVLIGDFCRKIH